MRVARKAVEHSPDPLDLTADSGESPHAPQHVGGRNARADAARRVEAALIALQEAMAAHGADSAEADAAAPDLDSDWAQLTAEEEQVLRGLSADLYMLSGEELPPPDPEPGTNKKAAAFWSRARAYADLGYFAGAATFAEHVYRRARRGATQAGEPGETPRAVDANTPGGGRQHPGRWETQCIE